MPHVGRRCGQAVRQRTASMPQRRQHTLSQNGARGFKIEPKEHAASITILRIIIAIMFVAVRRLIGSVVACYNYRLKDALVDGSVSSLRDLLT